MAKPAETLLNAIPRDSRLEHLLEPTHGRDFLKIEIRQSIYALNRFDQTEAFPATNNSNGNVQLLLQHSRREEAMHIPLAMFQPEQPQPFRFFKNLKRRARVNQLDGLLKLKV